MTSADAAYRDSDLLSRFYMAGVNGIISNYLQCFLSRSLSPSLLFCIILKGFLTPNRERTKFFCFSNLSRLSPARDLNRITHHSPSQSIANIHQQTSDDYSLKILTQTLLSPTSTDAVVDDDERKNRWRNDKSRWDSSALRFFISTQPIDESSIQCRSANPLALPPPISSYLRNPTTPNRLQFHRLLMMYLIIKNW